MKLTAARLTTVLAVLLGLAYVLVLSGRIAEDDSPSVNNTSGGGLSAFASLLRQSGFRVRTEDGLRPRFRGDEFVIVATDGLVAPSGLRGEETNEDDRLLKRLPLAPGGMMLLQRSPEIRSPAPREYVNRVTGERYQLLSGTGETTIVGLRPLEPFLAMFRDRTGGGIAISIHDARRIVLIDRGEIATNRCLDGPQNAALLIGLLRTVAADRTIVFYEGVSSEGSLLASLGKWAFAVRNQAILALLLLVATLGARFGLAPTARRRETGQREQSDALGNLLRRWRGPRIGIEAGIEQARRRLVGARKMPASTPREQWPKYLSPSLMNAIEEAEEWGRQKAREREALGAIAKLDAETDAEIAGVYRKA